MRGVDSDGTSVELCGNVDWRDGSAPTGSVELAMTEVGVGATDQRCVVSFPLAPANLTLGQSFGPEHGSGTFHLRGRFDPPCRPPASGAHFHQTVTWTVGETHVESPTFIIPVELGGDGQQWSRDREDEVFARRAHLTQRPSPEQDLRPDLEAMIDELALASTAIADAIPDGDQTCPAGSPPPSIVLTFEVLRSLASAADGTISDADALPMPLPSLLPASTATLDLYAAGRSIAAAEEPNWPPPESASFRIVRVLDYQAPVFGEAGPDGTDRPGWFTAGRATGIVYVVDRRTHALACQASFAAESSAEIAGERRRDIALPREDLQGNVSRAIEGALARITAR